MRIRRDFRPIPGFSQGGAAMLSERTARPIRDKTKRETARMPSFDSDGVQIHFEDRGTGEPVVLVHGFASRAEHNWGMTGWYELLAPKYRVIAMDCRGHGASGKPHAAADYGGTIMEDDVIRLMDHLGISRAILMGYSMGGRISLGLLVHHPDRFRAVVLGGIGAGAQMNDPQRRGGIVEALLADDPKSIAEETPRLFRQFAELNHNDLKALAACMSAERSLVDPAALRANKLPVLIVVGSKDTLVGSAGPLLDSIANSRLVEVEGRDHLNAPGDKRYQQAVMEFFAAAPK
jgi:pimeloyl-ACP methyl ester carboxylesterase